MVHKLTSDRNPLRIDTVPVPGRTGTIGMTLCPGKKDPYAKFGAWDRDLQADLQAIRAWGASAIVSLMEGPEFWLLGVPDFEAKVSADFRWLWLPIPDGGVPGEAFERRWAESGPELHGRLAAGERVLIHCRAGLGRTGMVASRLLVEAGLTPLQALNAVRRARPGTVETLPQEQYVLLLPQRRPGEEQAGATDSA
jgi:ADP-ribosyl-[dinitrogen reductase] hydrolase